MKKLTLSGVYHFKSLFCDNDDVTVLTLTYIFKVIWVEMTQFLTCRDNRETDYELGLPQAMDNMQKYLKLECKCRPIRIKYFKEQCNKKS